MATAASNGIWDIENGRSRIDKKSKIDEYTRAVNRICFSPQED
ncbi:20705_t:CDS:2 [Entrophospora sp. SA101]|nr:20705_t:CDS:2 [Entrophospora sp. SA101]